MAVRKIFPCLPGISLAATVLIAAGGAGEPARAQFPLEEIRMPPGFGIELFAGNVEGARSLELTGNGTLFVGTRSQGNVYAVLDDDGDFRADRVLTVAEGLYQPNGVAFRDGSLYVAEIHRILRFDDIESRLESPPEPAIVYDNLPDDRHHGWKFIRFGPDGKLYVPVGAPCNICEPELPYAALHRMNPDGTEFETYARGIRNTVGFDWNPAGNVLWFTDNGRDMMGDNIPPDELNRAPVQGLHFGYPYFHGGDIPDPEYGGGRESNEFTPPAQKLGPHVAALGMRFYRGEMFPEEYRGEIFIAEHGSWNRSERIGYRITLVRREDSTAVSYETFAGGWLRPDGSVWGRPVDLEHMPDGSLLVSDDHAGAIYRISYSEPVTPSMGDTVKIPASGNAVFALTDSAWTGEGFTHEWSLDGGPLEGASGPAHTIEAPGLPAGVHSLTLAVSGPEGRTHEFAWKIVIEPAGELSCDYNDDNRLDILDAVALLMLGVRRPADPLADFNGDGYFSAADVVLLLSDLLEDSCVDDQSPGGIALLRTTNQPVTGS